MVIEIKGQDLEKIELRVHNIALSVGDLIKERRKNSKLTIAELSKYSHVSSTVITDLENGRSLPRTEVLLKLACALEIPYPRLFSAFSPSLSTKKPIVESNTPIPLETVIKYIGLSSIDAKEVMSFIEFKKFQNKRRK